MPESTAAPIESSIFQVMKEASLLYCLPDNPFFLNPENSSHAVQEATYACAYLTVSLDASLTACIVRLRLGLCTTFLQSPRACLSPSEEHPGRVKLPACGGPQRYQDAFQRRNLYP